MSAWGIGSLILGDPGPKWSGEIKWQKLLRNKILITQSCHYLSEKNSWHFSIPKSTFFISPKMTGAIFPI